MLAINPIMVIIFEHTIQYLLNTWPMHGFLASTMLAAPNHIPLRYRCHYEEKNPNKCCLPYIPVHWLERKKKGPITCSTLFPSEP